MFLKFPKDDAQYSWTDHIKRKMIRYQLSEAKIKRVLKNPDRKEAGIAPDTLAAMKRNDRGDKKEEIWLMYQRADKRGQPRRQMQTDAPYQSKLDTRQAQINADSPRKSALSLRESARIRMISAWRYPGVSPKNKAIPIPDEIAEELGMEK